VSEIVASGDSRPVFSLDDLYDLVHRARARNPFDGRTREGRAWADGAWAVMQAAYAAHDEAKRKAVSS
jgi:hypothetical protein